MTRPLSLFLSPLFFFPFCFFLSLFCRKFPSANKSSLQRVVTRYNSVRKFPTISFGSLVYFSLSFCFCCSLSPCFLFLPCFLAAWRYLTYTALLFYTYVAYLHSVRLSHLVHLRRPIGASFICRHSSFTDILVTAK